MIRPLLLAGLIAAPLLATATTPLSFTRLDPAHHGGAGVQDGTLRLTPAGDHICFNADAATNEAFELYCAALHPPSLGVRVSGALASGSQAQFLTILPDGQRVLYLAPEHTVGIRELHVGHIDGSQPPQRLNTPLTGGQQIQSEPPPIYSATAGRVVFETYIEGQGTNRLRSVALSGPASEVFLDSALPSGSQVVTFSISPDGSRVVFSARTESNGPIELYSVPTAGGSAVRISGLMAGFGVRSNHIIITPDNAHALYIADALNPSQISLFSTPVNGVGQAQRISDPAAFQVYGFTLSPDGQHVVHHAWSPPISAYTFYVAPPSGENQWTLLDGPFYSSLESFASPSYAFTGNGQRVLISSTYGPDLDLRQIRSVRLDGSEAPLTLGQSARPRFAYIEAIDRVIFTSNGLLRAAAPDGSSNILLSSSLATNTEFSRWVPQAQRVVATATVQGKPLLYAFAPDNSTSAVQMGTATSSDPGLQGVWSLTRGNAWPAADGASVYHLERSIYATAAGQQIQFRLMRSPISGGSPTPITALNYLASGSTRYFRDVVASPLDPDMVIYLAKTEDSGNGDRFQLFAARQSHDIFADGFEQAGAVRDQSASF